MSERQGCQQTRQAVIENGEVLSTGFVAERATQPTFSDPGWTDDQTIAVLADPIIGCELEEERAIQAAMSAVIDVLDASLIAHPGGFDARVKSILLAHRRLVLEQETEPFGMLDLDRQDITSARIVDNGAAERKPRPLLLIGFDK
jgi:hypothetical protein